MSTKILAGVAFVALGAVACDGSGNGDSLDELRERDGDDREDGNDEEDAPGGVEELAAEPEQWVGDICDAVGDWRDEIEQLTAELQSDAAAAEGDAEEIKDLALTYLDDAISATDTMLEDFEQAGIPDVDEGEEVRDLMTDALEEVEDLFVDAREETEELSDDPLELGEGLDEIGSDLQAAGDRLEAAFDDASEEFDVPELDEAFEEESACASF